MINKVANLRFTLMLQQFHNCCCCPPCHCSRCHLLCLPVVHMPVVPLLHLAVGIWHMQCC